MDEYTTDSGARVRLVGGPDAPLMSSSCMHRTASSMYLADCSASIGGPGRAVALSGPTRTPSPAILSDKVRRARFGPLPFQTPGERGTLFGCGPARRGCT